MGRRTRFIWWVLLVILIGAAVWKLFLPHGSRAYLQKSSSSRELVVYVNGAVEKEGLVRLPLDARLDDALKVAKPSSQANLDLLNPAQRLKDGQKITVPFKQMEQISSSQGNNLGINNSITPNSNPNLTQVLGSNNISSSDSNLKININTAGLQELDKLPNIGPALAERIIQYRTEKGPFQKPEDLKNVSGIGDKTYEKMASMITVWP